MTEPLILTALLDADSQARFDAERQAHFPAARNFIPAHVTLFHALPGAEHDSVVQALRLACRGQAAVDFATLKPRFLGRGVAYDLHMPEIAALRAKLAASWQNWLSPQDRQGFRPHVTVQNKVSPEEARAVFDALQAAYAPWRGEVLGLTLWQYEGGPWAHLAEIKFRGART